MASPAVAAGKGDGAGTFPLLPTAVGFGVAGNRGTEWPIPTCVPAQCCHSCLGGTEGTCHRNQSGHFTCSPFCAYLCL